MFRNISAAILRKLHARISIVQNHKCGISGMFAKLIYYVDDDKLVGKYVDFKQFEYCTLAYLFININIWEWRISYFIL